jgi:hypothetical protein
MIFFMFRFLENNKNMFLPIKNKLKKNKARGDLCPFIFYDSQAHKRHFGIFF